MSLNQEPLMVSEVERASPALLVHHRAPNNRDPGRWVEVPLDKVNFVGGPDGVFATYREGDIIHFLAGDDGGWWEIARYHASWCEAISKNIYSYCTTGRRK